MPRKVFVAGEILTAADVNTNLMDQAVMVFDDSTARGSAIPSPSEGMVTYLKDTDALEKYTTAWEAVATGGILQVVQTVKTDTFSTTSTSFVDVTGLSVTITPSSASSKILVMADVRAAGNSGFSLKLTGGNSGTYIGDAASSRTRAVFGVENGDLAEYDIALADSTMIYLDSPATTSATTYTVQIVRTGSGTCYVNRTHIDTDTAAYPRGASSITVWEVAV